MSSDTNYLISQASAQLKEISAQHLNEEKNGENIVSNNNSSKSNVNSEDKLGSITIQDRFKNELEHLQSSQSTYLNDPDQSSLFLNLFKKSRSQTYYLRKYSSDTAEIFIFRVKFDHVYVAMI